MILPGLQSISVFCAHCEVLADRIRVGIFVAVPGWPPFFEVDLVRCEINSKEKYRVALPPDLSTPAYNVELPRIVNECTSV